MKLIVESGATKSDWRIMDGVVEKGRLLRPGMNVSSMPEELVRRTLGDTLAEVIGTFGVPDGVYLYVAGVVTDEIRARLETTLRGLTPEAEVDIQNDLTAAARAACGHGKGIAAILGTGSNACFWDGVNTVRKVYSGGFILGDEGGAAALGKTFLAEFLKGRVPEDLAADFGQAFDASYDSIVENVYRSGAPAKYLGSIAPFLTSRYGSSSFARSLVDANFIAFIERTLMSYDTSAYGVGVVGGFGYACREVFGRLCAERGILVRTFLPEPIDGLKDYHCAVL